MQGWGAGPRVSSLSTATRRSMQAHACSATAASSGELAVRQICYEERDEVRTMI